MFYFLKCLTPVPWVSNNDLDLVCWGYEKGKDPVPSFHSQPISTGAHCTISFFPFLLYLFHRISSSTLNLFISSRKFKPSFLPSSNRLALDNEYEQFSHSADVF